MNTKTTSGRRATALLLFFVLLVSLMTGISNAASIQDVAKSASMTLGHRETILETTAGTKLRACAYSYTTDNGLTGVGYCVDHGLDFTSRSLPITGKYLSSPATAGVYANGYPQHSLYTFKSLFAGDYPELNALTDSEYQYATQLAIWASLGQLGIAGTNHTSGRESIDQPSGDAQQERVFKAVQCLLLAGDEWNRVYQTGAYIRLERDVLGGNISIPADMSLETAARSEAYGIKRETIGGTVYYTRTYYVASATSTYYNNYNIDLWVTGAPAGTMFTYPGTNEELPHGMFREQATWATPTAYQRTNLNANEYEYVAQVKLAIPADHVSNAGEVTIHMATYPTQYDIYLCENTDYTEQSYIIADPSQGVIQNEAVLSWGSDITLTGDLIVQKVDGAGNPLAGAHFVLTGTDGSSRTGVSDGNGKVVWEKLNPTVTYTLTESQAPAGYGIMEAVNITIDAARDNFVTVRDDVSKRLTVHKQDKQNGYSLQGAVIVFEQIDGTFKTERKTDHAGNIQLSADDLPVGSYKVYEKSAPLGYEIDPNPQTVDWDGLHDVTLLFENTRKKTITIAKVDADTGYSLPHCTLAVYKDGQHIGDYLTNDNGLAYVSDVTTGDYVIREIIAPEGYVLDATDHIIHVDNYDPATTDDPRIVIKNHKKAQLTIVKYDAESGKGLPGVSFEVLRDTNPIGTYTTDSHGEIFLYDLEPGTYLVRESAVPAGYVLDTTPQEIKLEAGVWEYRLVFLNHVKPGMRLVKLDSQTMSPLPGATFRLAQVGGTFDQEFTTDENGEIDVSMLDPGTYTVTETKAPEGYVKDNGERVIHLEAGKNAQFVFTNTAKPSFQLVKLDSLTGERLPGVTFHIALVSDGTHYLDRVTDQNGEINLTGLLPGVYSIQEMSVPEGYVLDTREYHVELVPGKQAQLVLSNHHLPDLKIIKKDADTGTLLAGATFRVKKADGSTLTTETTNAQGEILLKHLDPGVYEVTEITPPVGYLPAEEPIQLITLTVNKLGTVEFTNHAKPSLTIRKMDSITGDPLKGVKFHVTYASNQTHTGEVNDLGDFYTDENGQVIITEIRDGWYKVTETQTAAGYAIQNPASQEFYLQAGTGKTVTFENTPLSALVVYKFDSETGEAIQGVTFQVRYLAGSSGTGGTVLGKYQTSANGSFTLTGLKAGTYVVEEIASDDGHVIDTAPQTAYISGKDQDVVELYFGNKPKGSLLVKKVDSVTHAPLSDVEFLVTTSDGTVVGNANGKFVTDSTGSILIEGVDPGTTLVVKETRAKAGYVLDDTPQTARIKAGKTVTLEFRDVPKGGLIVQKFDRVTKKPLTGAVFKITTSTGEYAVNNEGLTSSNGLYTTDEQGQIMLTRLAPATYVVTEIQAPDNYKLDGTAQTVVVNTADTQTLSFYDDPLCALSILKRDANTKKPLAGAEFTVTDSEGKVIGSNNGRYVTGTDGTVTVTGMAPDAAIIVTETKAPKGYVKDPTPKTIVVRSGVANSLTFEDEPTTVLTIHKYIEGTRNEPLAGVAFQVTDGNGGAVGPDDGIYYTDKTGTITLYDLEPGLTVKVREIKTVEGFVLDGTPQDIQIKAGGEQQLTFWNARKGTLRIVKLDSATKERLPGAKFEVRYADGRYVDQSGGKLSSNGLYTTDKRGEITITGLTGTVVATELEAPEGYVIDEATRSQTVVVNPEDAQTLTFYNQPISGILIHKVDALTGKGIYGASFLAYDKKMTPLGQYTTDQNGYAHIDDLTGGGAFHLRELSNEGYVVDTQIKTVTVKPGENTVVEWPNTPITGQIQITKTSADYNAVNGWPAGSPIPGTVFEIYDRAGNVVDTIQTDKNGVAVTRPLPLGRYQAVEYKSADHYLLDRTPIDLEIEFPGQIVKAAMTNQSVYTNVSITKRGYAEVMPGQSVRYDVTGIANNSNVSLESFYWRDTLPVNAVRLEKVVTGTWNTRGSYKIVYATNLNQEYRTLADNLDTARNYVLDASPAALGLASNECVTEFMVVFGVVPSGFRQVETAQVYCSVLPGVTGGSQFTNAADVGGVYNGQWVMASDWWVTRVYAPAKPLPRTGY